MKRVLRFLFSRYFVCAVFIILELLVMIFLFEYALAFSAVLSVLARVISTLVFISLINRHSCPDFKITWLALAMVAPIFGSVLYLIFSTRYLSRSERQHVKRIREGIENTSTFIKDKESSLASLAALAGQNRAAAGRAYAIMSCDPFACLTPGGVLKYYPSGEAMYADLLEAIDAARHYVYLEYFIIEDGDMWQGIYSRLCKKAAEGIDVRVLYDDVGCLATLPRGFDKELGERGIKCRRFSRVTPTVTRSHNNRDHRKILVADGSVAFTGGVNVADEYINAKKKFGYWKDSGVKVCGDAARGFARMFLLSYDLAGSGVSDYGQILDRELQTAEDPQRSCTGGGFVMPIGSGPGPVYNESVGKAALMNIINMATATLYITTPYLIIDYELTEALRNASRRGVDVRIITPGIPDKRLVYLMTRGSYKSLCEAGVRIFEYTPGFMHSKCIVADGICAMVGSINFDHRSLVHHFEDALVIFSSDVIEEITDDFFSSLALCREVCGTPLAVGERIMQSLMRIIAPLL